MENASKALIMAATILISIVIVSLGLYLAVTFSSYSSQVDEETRRNQISQFNSQFLTYQGREVTIHDIITVANLARENNQNYELTSADAGENTLYIQVVVEGISNNFENESSVFANNTTRMESQIIEVYDSGLGKNVQELKKYTCTQVSVSKVTERVYYIKFEEK